MYQEGFFRAPVSWEKALVREVGEHQFKGDVAGVVLYMILWHTLLTLFLILSIMNRDAVSIVFSALLTILFGWGEIWVLKIFRRKLRKIRNEEYEVQIVTVEEILYNMSTMDALWTAELTVESGKKTYLGISNGRGYDPFFKKGNKGLIVHIQGEPNKGFSKSFLCIPEKKFPEQSQRI